MKRIPKDEADYEVDEDEGSNKLTKIERDIMVKIAKENKYFLLKIKCPFQNELDFLIISEYIPGNNFKLLYFLRQIS